MSWRDIGQTRTPRGSARKVAASPRCFACGCRLSRKHLKPWEPARHCPAFPECANGKWDFVDALARGAKARAEAKRIRSSAA